MIETNRLKIYAASEEQMEAFIKAQTVDVLKAAYTEMLNGCLAHPDSREWYAIWMIELKDGTHVGELCFKGVNEEGVTEIGYGIEKVRELGFSGIIVKGNHRFYNTVGFRTSSEYGIFPVSGYPITELRCQMCMELYDGSLKDKGGYVVYDMYFNA